MQYERDTLLRDLKINVVEIHFTKVDGSNRKMKCTLIPKWLPPNTNMQHLEEMHHKEENKSTIAVWDLEQSGWRSFRIENVQYAEVIENF
jgi:WYL_2, Sm-like SH3 beta-barrel fold